jgi:flavin reductase (DIM6/NTAB) family NADH-FMN oxidoreductase RutF
MLKEIMDQTNLIGEQLRQSMRRWAAGVAVVCSFDGENRHGMTVNSFTSISLDPPHVCVTMANWTRTFRLVMQSGVFSVTILNDRQQDLADRFAGRTRDSEDRFASVETFSLVTGAPLIAGGLAHIDCRIVHTFSMKSSTLMVGEVLAAQSAPETNPLLYFNRSFHRLSE